jgi:hypothetical protein
MYVRRLTKLGAACWFDRMTWWKKVTACNSPIAVTLVTNVKKGSSQLIDTMPVNGGYYCLVSPIVGNSHYTFLWWSEVQSWPRPRRLDAVTAIYTRTSSHRKCASSSTRRKNHSIMCGTGSGSLTLLTPKKTCFELEVADPQVSNFLAFDELIAAVGRMQ